MTHDAVAAGLRVIRDAKAAAGLNRTPAATEGSTGLHFEDLASLLKRDIGAQRWLARNLIPMGALTYFGGGPKNFKSWLALFLSAAVAEGSAFLGRELDAEGPVLIVDAEVSPAMLQQRVRLVAAGHQVGLDALARIHVHNGRLFLDREDQLARLKAAVAEIQPALIVLDPLAKLHAGLNENDASDMAWLAGCVRELTLIGGPAVVIVHHTVKASDGKRGGSLLRGSSALWADADALLLVERDAGELAITVDGRYCSGDQRLAARIEIDADHLLPTARLIALDAPTLRAAHADAVLEVLRDHPAGLSKTAIREGLNVSGKTVGRVLDALRDQGLASMTRERSSNIWRAI